MTDLTPEQIWKNGQAEWNKACYFAEHSRKAWEAGKKQLADQCCIRSWMHIKNAEMWLERYLLIGGVE